MPQAVLLPFSQRDCCVQQLAADLAEQLNVQLAQCSRAALLLPGGSSPQLLLPVLAQCGLDWTRVDLCSTDERWVPAASAQSNWRLLQAGLPGSACLDPRQAATTPEQAARRWAQQLIAWLPFAAVLLGMGEDGHFASLFPSMPGLAAALDPQTPPATLVAQAPSEPRVRLSPNLALLCTTRWLGLLAFGERKRQLIDAVLADEPESHDLPLYALLRHSPLPVRLYWAP